ncbi:MAG: AMP-binding protein, partial [bacterium]|nr:AMP-binding protein [bacterium]
QLKALYQGLPLPELEVQYADFAVWQRQWLRGEILEAQLGYWRAQLADLPVLELPCDRPRPAMQSFRGAMERFLLPDKLHRRLLELSEERGVTLFMTLLAAFQAVLGRLTGQRNFAVGTPVANRNRAETEGLIGFFVNTLVLRADLSGAPAAPEPTFAQLLTRVRDVALDAYAHQDLPFEKLVEELEPKRNLGQNPLFQVLFALYYAPAAIRELGPGLRVELEGVAGDQAKFDLTLSLTVAEERLTNGLEYNTDLFDLTTIRRLAGHLEILLAGAVADPERRLSELPLVPAAERHQLLCEWNDSRTADPGDLLLHALFAGQAAATPEAVAVAAGDEQLSYRELEARANRLAQELEARGVGPEVRVGISMERSPAMVVGLLAILKAGGAYLPLDPTHPEERLAAMLEDSRAPVLLSEEALAGRLRAASLAAELLCLDRVAAAIRRRRAESPASGPASASPAYVLYTSGSTGRPKGVVIPHRAIGNHMLWMQEALPLEAGDRVLQKTPFSFDASVWEFWAPLLAGARLVLARPGEHRDPAALVDTVR